VLILVTDLLSCPRCGPAFGVVALVDRLEERRVVEGRLGCSNCRASYPVRDGVADLRSSGGGVVEEEGGAPVPEEAVRLAALMGLAGVAGTAVVAGPGARHAAAIAELVPEVEVLAVGATLRGGRAPGVSRILAEPGRLPVRDGLVRAAALTGAPADAGILHDGLRVLAPGGRLVLEPAAEGSADLLRAAGASLLLEDGDTVVAAAPGRPVELLRNVVR
jgi:uncharacterized protein YbaR (Trm112 family)